MSHDQFSIYFLPENCTKGLPAISYGKALVPTPLSFYNLSVVPILQENSITEFEKVGNNLS